MWLPRLSQVLCFTSEFFDSLVIIAANYKLIPNLNRPGGLAGVARSILTSGALDRIVSQMGIKVKFIL